MRKLIRFTKPQRFLKPLRFTLTAIAILVCMTATAQNKFQPIDLKIYKGSMKIVESEVKDGLLIDKYSQFRDLILKHNKVELSPEFPKENSAFFKNNVYYFIPILKHCGQPALHNTIVEMVGENKMNIKCIRVYSHGVCPGVVYPEPHYIIIPKKHLTNKKIEVEIKYEEVMEHPADDNN